MDEPNYQPKCPCLEQWLGDWDTARSDQGDQNNPKDGHTANEGCNVIEDLTLRLPPLQSHAPSFGFSTHDHSSVNIFPFKASASTDQEREALTTLRRSGPPAEGLGKLEMLSRVVGRVKH